MPKPTFDYLLGKLLMHKHYDSDVVPDPTFVSHFNTTDGTNTCTVSDVSTTSRLVSNPTTEGNPFKIGGWTAGTAHDCLHTNAQAYTTNNQCSFENTSSTIEVNIYDADGTTPLNTHTTAAITGNTDVTVDDIRIRVTSWAADSGKYKGIVTINFNIDTVISDGGRYSFEAIHHNGGTDYSKTDTDIFSDTENLTAAITSTSIGENVAVLVRKSGTYAYDTGSTFSTSITDIDDLNSRSYPTTQVNISGTEYGLPALNLQGGDLTGWTNAHDDDNDSYLKLDWTINTSNYFLRTTTANISARTVDWANGSWVDSTNGSVMIDTYNDTSTRIFEDFTGESSRLEDDFTTSWDSTQDLTSYDGNDNLQVGEGSFLFYPVTDYGAYDPVAGSQPDYSAYSGDALYYREMYHTSTAHSNGIFEYSGVTEADITADDIIVEISLDGTDWYNCNESYLGGALADGDGCRIDSGIYNMTANDQLRFTLGAGGATAVGTGGPSGWGILIRITMPDTSTIQMGQIEITDWT